MKFRNVFTLFAIVAIAACGGAAEEPVADTAPAAEEAPMDDAAAIAAMADEFVLHYNMGHAAVVDGYYAEEGVLLAANGSVLMDAEARVAYTEGEMEASPTLSVDTADVAVFGDAAVAHGSYAVEVTPEGGEAVTTTGSWMGSYERVDGEWKIGVLLTNFDDDPPENMPEPMGGDEPPPDMDDSPIAELMGYYATHFNMGHGGMVASRYAEDAIAAFAGQPKLEGRAAIEENMNARIDEAGNPQLTIHVVDAQEVGEEFVFGGGWYEMSADNTGNSAGAFLVLARRGEDGNLQIQWAASNGNPVIE